MKDKTTKPNISDLNYEVNGAYAAKAEDDFDRLEILPQQLFDQCFIDYSGRQFACKQGTCHNQEHCIKNNLLKETIDFHELHFHAEDKLLWCETVYPDILNFIRKEPFLKNPDYRFIFNHRYIRKDGSISQFIHEGSVNFYDDRLFPKLNLKVFFEIADIKSDETIALTIFRYSGDKGYQKVFSKEYGKSEKSILTNREVEIIRLCDKGLSSKMIANRLNLSVHTVKNHKRNSMEKTLTHNITELVHICHQNRWL